jgi:cytochrome c553
MMIKKILAIAVLGLMLPLSATAAGDAAAGEAKAGVCAGCHGPTGMSSNPAWPNLAGQKDAYLVKQMKDYRDGKRQDPMMAPMVMGLTDQDIEDLAAFYAAQKAE